MPLTLLVHLASNYAILYWVVYRLSGDIDLSPRQIAERYTVHLAATIVASSFVYRVAIFTLDLSCTCIFLLHRASFGLARFSPGRVFAVVCALHAAGSALMWALQRAQHGHALHSWRNFLDLDGRVDWVRCVGIQDCFSSRTTCLHFGSLSSPPQISCFGM